MVADGWCLPSFDAKVLQIELRKAYPSIKQGKGPEKYQDNG